MSILPPLSLRRKCNKKKRVSNLSLTHTHTGARTHTCRLGRCLRNKLDVLTTAGRLLAKVIKTFVVGFFFLSVPNVKIDK